MKHQGHDYRFTFSNYLSPSAGRLEIDGENFSINCELDSLSPVPALTEVPALTAASLEPEPEFKFCAVASGRYVLSNYKTLSDDLATLVYIDTLERHRVDLMCTRHRGDGRTELSCVSRQRVITPDSPLVRARVQRKISAEPRTALLEVQTDPNEVTTIDTIVPMICE